ncbi:hypothetical protein Aperf_G00000017547 [Anoplocephala perfoliata]
MSRLGTFVTNIVKTAIFTIHPNKVEEYPYEQYAANFYLFERVQEFYHSFILYKIANYYDMIYVPPASSLDTSSKDRRVFSNFSLFRFHGDVNDGILIFTRFTEVIHDLTSICASCNVKVDKAWLEKVTYLCRSHPKWTLAHFAAAINFPEAFRYDQVSTHLNEADEKTGETPLHVAVKAESVKTVQTLLALPEIRLDIRDLGGNTVLHVAVSLCSLELIQLLLDINIVQNDEKATSNASASVVCKPIGFKNSDRLDINALNAAGESCLHLAFRSTVVSEAIVSILLQAGADPRIGTTDFLPIHLAVEKGLIGCVNLMYSYYPDVINLQTREKRLSTLHVANKDAMFNHLLELGADPNLRNAEGRTVLHEAVESEKLDTVVQLLIHAVDVNATDDLGITPLHLAAARCKDVHIVYALIVFEANVNATDAEGLSPRHWLCRHESGVYQRNPMRDKILYALDVVQAQRCPMGRTNCTSGCINRLAAMSPNGSDNISSKIPFKSSPAGRSSFSYLSQLFQDISFTAMASRPNNDPKTVELFNGTPPDPVLSNSDVTQDLDTDLFLYLSAKIPSSPPRRSAPDLRSLRRSGSSPMSAPTEDVDIDSPGARSSPALPETMQDDVGESSAHPQPEIEPDATSTPVQKSWFRRTIITRYLSTLIPGLDGLLTDEPTPIDEAPVVLTNDLEEAKEINDLECDLDLPEAVVAQNIQQQLLDQDQEVEVDQPIEINGTCDTATQNEKAGDQKPQANGDPNSHYLWRQSINSCSSLPGVLCCADRNARWLVAQHRRMNEITHTSLPPANLSKLCPPSASSGSESASMKNAKRDPEGFRVSLRGYRLLCLDGGGIRGLILCQVLRAIERAAGRPIRDLYDWIIGTSTGAMLALNLAQGKCVRYNRCLYFRLMKKIFFGSRPYPTEGLESLLREEFGDSAVMSEIENVRVSVTALRGDYFPPRLHMFRNYPAPSERMERLIDELIEARSAPGINSATSDGPTDQCVVNGNSSLPASETSLSANVSYNRLLTSCLRDLFGETLRQVGRGEDDEFDLQEAIISLLSSFSRRYQRSEGIEQPVPNSEQLVWKAARASGAAPSYFRACGPYLDGGLISNNPTIDLLTEAQELNIVRRLRREPTIPIASVTSLGTGRIPYRAVRQLDVFRPQNMSEAYRIVLGVTELSKIVVEMATMSEGRIVERSRAWCSSLGIPFFRFSPLLSENVSLDSKDVRAILQMLWETEAYLCNCQDRIIRLAESLLASDAPPSPVQSDIMNGEFPRKFSK